jgi:hypothetical protein
MEVLLHYSNILRWKVAFNVLVKKDKIEIPLWHSFLYMEDNFLRISVVIINIFVSVIFTNLVLLHDCNYAVIEENLWSRNSKYLYTNWGRSWLTFPIILCLLLYLLVCACGFAYFIIFNNLFNNKLLDQDLQWVHEASLEFSGSR